MVAALGMSLGVNVGDLFAASPTTPAGGGALQSKIEMPSDWGRADAYFLKLSDQIKWTEASQLKFWNQIKGESRQGKIDAMQYKALQANEYKLSNEINALRANLHKIPNDLNLQKGGQANQLKYENLKANEIKLANQIKLLEANELKISSQIKLLQVK